MDAQFGYIIYPMSQVLPNSHQLIRLTFCPFTRLSMGTRKEYGSRAADW